MLLKYLDLHNKILRDAADPDKVAAELLEKGYYVVGVNVHNDGTEIKGKEHFYRFFETHFEMFEQKGLLMLPAVEIKIRDGNYEALPKLAEEFSRKFIPIHHKGEVHHVPFMIFVHGGKEEANRISAEEEKVDLLCHPLKDGGRFGPEMARSAKEHDVGIELNYREYMISEDKERHLDEMKALLKTCHDAGDKIFLFSATIKEEELVHIQELLEYGRLLHEDMLHESIENVHELLQRKYSPLLKKVGFDINRMKERQMLP